MRLFTHGVRLPQSAGGTTKRTLIVYHDGQPISRVEMKGGTTFSTMRFGRSGMIRLFDATAQGEALVAEHSFDKLPAQDFALQITGSVPVDPAPNPEAQKCDDPATEPMAPQSPAKESVQEILARLRSQQK